VLSDAAILALAQVAIDEFEARAVAVLDQMDNIVARPGSEPDDGQLAELAQQLDDLILLRYAVAGSGAQLEERLAAQGGSGLALQPLRQASGAGPAFLPLGAALTGVSGDDDPTSGITNAYARFADDFDTSVNKMISDAQSGGVPSPSVQADEAAGGAPGSAAGGASTVSTASLTTDGLVVQARQSLRDVVSGAASEVQTSLRRLAQQLGQ
jgi:hypothetical protein